MTPTLSVLALLLTALLATTLTLAPAATAAIDPLPTGTDVDYQLGGDSSVPGHVGIVVRDRESSPIDGKYNVCYVNGFQTQPNEKKLWKSHWNLVLKRNGKAVEDSAWGEWLLDVRTAGKRDKLAAIVGDWIQGCADDGYDAVEFDNLDSFTRSHQLITKQEAIAYAQLLVDAAHDAGLAAGQKNLAGFDGTSIGYDFAVAEECGRYKECSSYTKYFGDEVLSIEYRRQDFRWTCQRFGDDLAVVLRDRNLTPRGVHEWC